MLRKNLRDCGAETTALGAGPRSARGLLRGASREAMIFALSLALVAAFWEVLARSGLYPIHLFPPPSRILPALRALAVSGELGMDLRASALRWLAGFALGTLCGAVAGFLTGGVRLLRESAGQVLHLCRTTPFIVLIPLAILWFGLGEIEKIAVVAWGAFFPVWLSTQAGVLGVEREYVWAARCLGARGMRLYWDVHRPRCLPFIVTGARVSISTATFALAAAEMAGAFEGLAYRVFYAHQMFQTERMMAGILVIAFLGLALDRLFLWTIRRLMPWWEEER
ncbi:MAG: ABC transporter permease [Elusimicrobiota bacterium]